MIDPADFNVLAGTFKSIAQEMSDILQRAAYSSIVREAKDCSTCIMDASGRTVAQAETIPIHMNSLAAAIPFIRERYKFSELTPTDAFITNNPYQNGQHLNDIIFIMPVFYDERLVAFAGSICHHLEVGGAVAGSNADASEIFQEGIILPTMKIDTEKDLGEGPVEQFIAHNVRLPDIVLGDFHAQIAAVLRGRALLQELFARYGANLAGAAMGEVQDYSERMLRQAIAALPDGQFSAEDSLDGRTLDSQKPTIRATVTIAGDEAIVDLSASDDQVNWPVNNPVASTQSAVLTVFGQLAGAGVPTNDGTYRPIHIRTRKGSILEPERPAPVRGRMSASYKTASAVKHALAKAAPERFTASGADTTNTVTMSLRDDNGVSMFAEIVMGGNGAGPGCDGADVVAQMLSNTGNTPVEAIEMDHTFVRIDEYSMIQDSGGAGQFRGGLGARRVYEILQDNVLVSTNGDRHETRPWALAGGHEGSLAKFAVTRDGVTEQIPAASNIHLNKGDRFVLEISGGGGYGNPEDRDVDSIRKDIRTGHISESSAQSVYGLV
jgi:N-methylhydantoinase B